MSSPSHLDCRDVSVLIVDPNHNTRGATRVALQTLGVTSITDANSSNAALRELQAFSPDMIISDQYIDEGMSGLDLAEHIRASSGNPYALIMLLCENPNLWHVTAALKTGVSELLPRPTPMGAVQEKFMAMVRDTRLFIACETYTGPDRRRKNDNPYSSSCRRIIDADTFAVSRESPQLAAEIAAAIYAKKDTMQQLWDASPDERVQMMAISMNGIEGTSPKDVLRAINKLLIANRKERLIFAATDPAQMGRSAYKTRGSGHERAGPGMPDATLFKKSAKGAEPVHI